MAKKTQRKRLPLPRVSRQEIEKDPLKVEFGHRIYRLMRDRVWNQSELARRADISRDDVSRYINGVSWPTDEKLAGLCKALETTAEELGVPSAGILIARSRTEPTPRLPPFAVIHGENPRFAWLIVNRAVQSDTAFKIGELLHNDNAPDDPGAPASNPATAYGRTSGR